LNVRARSGFDPGLESMLLGSTAMSSRKAAAVLSILLYSQGLLGIAALAAVLLRHPEAPTKAAVSISTFVGAVAAARAG
jgi:hypothetical protein